MATLEERNRSSRSSSEPGACNCRVQRRRRQFISAYKAYKTLAQALAITAKRVGPFSPAQDGGTAGAAVRDSAQIVLAGNWAAGIQRQFVRPLLHAGRTVHRPWAVDGVGSAVIRTIRGPAITALEQSRMEHLVRALLEAGLSKDDIRAFAPRGIADGRSAASACLSSLFRMSGDHGREAENCRRG